MNITFLLQYTIAYCTTMLVCVFLLRIPFVLTNENSLVYEYYFQHFNTTIILDYILILVYLGIAYFFMYIFEIKRQIYKLIVVILTTIVISGSFYLYYMYQPMNSTFFSRWFHKAGYNAIIYDIILLTFTYTIVTYIQNNINN